jgi:hypothetical protein
LPLQAPPPEADVARYLLAGFERIVRRLGSPSGGGGGGGGGGGVAAAPPCGFGGAECEGPQKGAVPHRGDIGEPPVPTGVLCFLK